MITDFLPKTQQPTESSTTTTGPQAGFSQADQDLAGYLYENLIKDFKHYYRCQRLTDQNNKAVTAIFQRFNNQSKADRHDCVTSFIINKLPLILQAHPTTLESYLLERNIILTSFKNWLIDQWRHNNIERKYTSYIVDYSDSNGDNMIDNIPDNADDKTAYQLMLEENHRLFEAFTKTLSTKHKRFVGAFSVGVTSKEIAKQLGCTARYVNINKEEIMSLWFSTPEYKAHKAAWLDQ